MIGIQYWLLALVAVVVGTAMSMLMRWQLAFPADVDTTPAIASDGTIYIPVSAKPGDPQNSRLTQFIEGKVKGTGTHRSVSGLHTIEIETVEAAS